MLPVSDKKQNPMDAEPAARFPGSRAEPLVGQQGSRSNMDILPPPQFYAPPSPHRLASAPPTSQVYAPTSPQSRMGMGMSPVSSMSMPTRDSPVSMTTSPMNSQIGAPVSVYGPSGPQGLAAAAMLPPPKTEKWRFSMFRPCTPMQCCCSLCCPWIMTLEMIAYAAPFELVGLGCTVTRESAIFVTLLAWGLWFSSFGVFFLFFMLSITVGIKKKLMINEGLVRSFLKICCCWSCFQVQMLRECEVGFPVGVAEQP